MSAQVIEGQQINGRVGSMVSPLGNSSPHLTNRKVQATADKVRSVSGGTVESTENGQVETNRRFSAQAPDTPSFSDFFKEMLIALFGGPQIRISPGGINSSPLEPYDKS